MNAAAQLHVIPLRSAPAPTSNTANARQTLREFFGAWAWPIVLEPAGTHHTTKQIYWEALDWWERLTANPPLGQITQADLATFATGLRSATFRRGLSGRPRPLAPATQRKICATVAAILRHAGPQHGPQPTAEILPRPLWVPKPRPSHRPRGAPTVDELAAIMRAAERAPGPATPNQWRLLIGTAYYTGLRIGTVLALRWEWIDPHPHGPRWQLPPEATPKTGKAFTRAIHAGNLAILAKLAGERHTWPAVGPLLDWPTHYRTACTHYAQLQSAAQIPAARRFSFQSIRRAHAQTVAESALTAAMQLAASSLQHASASTTAAHYATIEHHINAALPIIWQPS